MSNEKLELHIFYTDSSPSDRAAVESLENRREFVDISQKLSRQKCDLISKTETFLPGPQFFDRGQHARAVTRLFQECVLEFSVNFLERIREDSHFEQNFC